MAHLAHSTMLAASGIIISMWNLRHWYTSQLAPSVRQVTHISTCTDIHVTFQLVPLVFA